MTGVPDRQDILNQACNHKRAVFILDFFVKTVGYFDINDIDINDKTI